MPHDSPRASGEGAIPDALALAFAPVHKAAFGVAIGAATGLVFFAATVVVVLRGTDVGLYLLSQYFYGYEVSWTGAAIGLFWGFAVGFIGGWFIAFCRNLALAISIFVSRTRGELHATADFLDHI